MIISNNTQSTKTHKTDPFISMFLHPQTFVHTSTMPVVCITPPCKLNHYLPRLRTPHTPLQPLFHLYQLHYIYSLYATKLHQLYEVHTIALKVDPSSFLQGWSKMASPTTSPCAACKFLRRKCQPECVFAPYFPPDQPAKFANVHKVFGASNVTKLLNELHPHQREDAVNSLAYEADMRLRDPVYGCVGVISILQHQLRQLQMDLTCAKSELSKYQSLGLITGGAGGGSAVGLGLGREQFFGGGGRHDHHQQMVMRSYDMEMARLGAYDAGLLAVNMSPAGIGTLATLSQQPRAGGDDRLCMGPS